MKHEIDDIGMLAFLHLFENSPEAKHNFKMFKDIHVKDLQTSEIFRNHSIRVVSVIRKVNGKPEIASQRFLVLHKLSSFFC